MQRQFPVVTGLLFAMSLSALGIIHAAEPRSGIDFFGITDGNHKVWNSSMKPAPSTPLVDVSTLASAPMALDQVAVSPGAGNDLQAVAVSQGSGKLLHALRRGDGTWTPFANVIPETHSDPGRIAQACIASVQGEAHVVVTTSAGGLWHTIRRRDGNWTRFGDVFHEAGNRGPFRSISCSGDWAENRLHLAGVAQNGSVWHTIRFGDGHWAPLGDVKREAGDVGRFLYVALAQDAGEVHVVGVASSGGSQVCTQAGAKCRLFHTIRRADGTWYPFGDVFHETGDLATATAIRHDAGSMIDVSATVGVDGLNVLVLTQEGNPWNTVRRPDKTWTPWSDVRATLGDFTGGLVDIANTTFLRQ